jgi:hypothetical protein
MGCRAVALPNSVGLIHNLEIWLALRFQSESVPGGEMGRHRSTIVVYFSKWRVAALS